MHIMHDRTKFIGSSDIAGILGVSKYKTPLDIYNSKVNPQPNIETQVMRRGKILEPVVLAFVEQDKNMLAAKTNFHVYSSEYDFLASEIDCITKCDTQLEIKTSSVFMGKSWGETFDDIPIDYLCQCYWAMGMNNKDSCLMCVLIDLEVKYYVIPQNIDMFNNFKKIAIEFWNNHIIPRVPPPAKTCGDLYNLYPNSEGSIEAIPELVHKIYDLQSLKGRIKELSEEKDKIEFDIKNFMKDKQILTFDNRELATFKIQNRKGYTVEPTTTKVLNIKKKGLINE